MTTYDDLLRNAPLLPRETCPYINDAQGTVEAVVKGVQAQLDILDSLTGKGPLENLRQMNEKLRECAEFWRETAQELADERDRLAAKLEDA